MKHRRKPANYYSIAAARWYRYHRRLRLHPEERARAQALARQLGSALSDPSQSITQLSRVGISFTRWQQWRIRFALWLGRTRWAQRILLRSFQ
jgi:hypothetical protein